MKLTVSIFAENLQIICNNKIPDPFAIITLLQKEENDEYKPIILGQTETLMNTSSPVFTKKCKIKSFELGQPVHVVVTMYNNKNATNEKIPIGSVLFEIGTVLGCTNSMLAKEIKKDANSIVGIRLDEQSNMSTAATPSHCTNNGTLHFQLRASDLTIKDGLLAMGLNLSDPFYEIQRLRRSRSCSHRAMWDTIYKSSVITNDCNPVWPDVYLDMDAICTNKDEKIRIVVSDNDKDGQFELIGYVQLTVNEILNHNYSGYTLMDKKGKNGGAILIMSASIEGIDEEEALSSDEHVVKQHSPNETIDSTTASIQNGMKVSEDEPEIVADIPEDDIDYATITSNPTFFDYVKGGCDLRVIIGIDTTASNGNPRSDTSLHYFIPDEKNDYEQALYSICSILSKYDSDQRFPIYGFGAKMDGIINHCFLFDETEADGVDGILNVYRTRLRSGLIMSSPRDYSAVILQAGDDAKKNFEISQSYSILLLFTNGSTADEETTIEALKEVDGAPLSIVIIGVGNSDANAFTGSHKLEQLSRNTTIEHGGLRDKLRMVHFTAELKDDNDKLTSAALDGIPKQLETYFISKGIQPLDPPSQGDGNADEIVVQPYNPDTDVVVPMEINLQTGQATVVKIMIPPSVITNCSNKRPVLNNMKKIGKDIQGSIVRSQQYRSLKKTFRNIIR